MRIKDIKDPDIRQEAIFQFDSKIKEQSTKAELMNMRLIEAFVWAKPPHRDEHHDFWEMVNSGKI